MWLSQDPLLGSLAIFLLQWSLRAEEDLNGPPCSPQHTSCLFLPLLSRTSLSPSSIYDPTVTRELRSEWI